MIASFGWCQSTSNKTDLYILGGTDGDKLSSKTWKLDLKNESV